MLFSVQIFCANLGTKVRQLVHLTLFLDPPLLTILFLFLLVFSLFQSLRRTPVIVSDPERYTKVDSWDLGA